VTLDGEVVSSGGEPVPICTEAIDLTAVVASSDPEIDENDVAWRPDNPDVADVDEVHGVVTAVGVEGSTNIIASIDDADVDAEPAVVPVVVTCEAASPSS
jgi:hypothetical protein